MRPPADFPPAGMWKLAINRTLARSPGHPGDSSRRGGALGAETLPAAHHEQEAERPSRLHLELTDGGTPE